MPISEPATLATDYVLAALAGWCAWTLRSAGESAVRWWALALSAVALAAIAGGTYHGFHTVLSATAASKLWTLTALAMGAASFALVSAAITSAASGRARRILISAAAVKFATFSAWMMRHDDFAYVMADYAAALAIVAGLASAGRLNGAPGHRGYILGGIGVSIAAALVQRSGIRFHQHFNHNDLMHIVQMVGIWLLYQGGARLGDAGGLHERQS